MGRHGQDHAGHCGGQGALLVIERGHPKAYELWFTDEHGEETLLETFKWEWQPDLDQLSRDAKRDGGWKEVMRVRNEGLILSRRRWFRKQYRMYLILPSLQLTTEAGE
jgi:hypothetical protein